ncbi:GTPase activating protein (GAP) for Rho1p [Elasticomyces elasticus]|nr:GTPase activating protein (GAP) for Rho1p [Elasticomyces elasticus]
MAPNIRLPRRAFRKTMMKVTATKVPTPQRTTTDATLRPTASPTQSYHSTDQSDADLVGDDMPATASEQSERERKRHRWRFSRSQNRVDQPQTPGTDRDHPLAGMSSRQQTASRSTMGSSTGGQARPSFQEPGPMPPPIADMTAVAPPHTHSMQSSSTDPIFSDSEREKKGPMSWIRGKLQERREKDAEKRAKTPERNRNRSESKPDLQAPTEAIPVRGKSLEQQRAMATHSQVQMGIQAPTRQVGLTHSPPGPRTPGQAFGGHSQGGQAPATQIPSQPTNIGQQSYAGQQPSAGQSHTGHHFAEQLTPGEAPRPTSAVAQNGLPVNRPQASNGAPLAQSREQ